MRMRLVQELALALKKLAKITRLLPFAILLLTACAANQNASIEADSNLEATNRFMLERNLDLYRSVVEPGVRAYRAAAPAPLRAGLSNLLANLKGPRIFINDLLQGEAERAAVTAARFLVNTGLGLGGIFDPASEMGLARHEEDFGQTLAVWKVESGPFLILPVIGSTTPRDLAGNALDLLLDPFSYFFFPELLASRIAGQELDFWSKSEVDVDALAEASPDFYRTVEALYFQQRNFEIRNGTPPD